MLISMALADLMTEGPSQERDMVLAGVQRYLNRFAAISDSPPLTASEPAQDNDPASKAPSLIARLASSSAATAAPPIL